MQKNALLMFSDKDGSEIIAQRLINLGYHLYGSAGTTKHLIRIGIEIIDIATMVGDPILNHKVVSLSREIHAGLLANGSEEFAELANLNIQPFEVVLIDLYPLEQTVAKEGVTIEKVRETTDIGGPTAASSAAKGCRVIGIEVAQREIILSWLEAGKPDEQEFLLKLEAHVNYFVSRYRGLSANFLDVDKNYLIIHGGIIRKLKYGENPHQKFAALYAVDNNDPLALHNFDIVYPQGARDSYVTATDVDRVVETVIRICAGNKLNYKKPGFVTVAVKHGNACGASFNKSEEVSILNAISGDCEAVLGAVVACNFIITKEYLELIFRSHDPQGKKWGMLAALVCQDIEPEALAVLKGRNSNCLVYVNDFFNTKIGPEHMQKTMFRSVRGGFIKQDASVFIPCFTADNQELYMTSDKLLSTDKQNLIFAWAINSTSNSNTITIVRNGKLLGNAVGQQKRVASSKLAIEKAEFSIQYQNQSPIVDSNTVAWGDSFFPYPDGIEVLANAGVKIIGATRGSKRDLEIFTFCLEREITCVTFPDTIARGFFAH